MNDLEKSRLDNYIINGKGDFIGKKKLAEVSYYENDIYEGDELYSNDRVVLLEHELKQYHKEQVKKMGLVKLADKLVLITDDGYEIKDLYRILQEALLELTQSKEEIIKFYDLVKGEAWV